MTLNFQTMRFSGVPSGESNMDFPTAWALQREFGDSLEHHPKCSFSQANMLCDCGALGELWDRIRDAVAALNVPEVEDAETTHQNGTSEGRRVYVAGETSDWPLGWGTVVDEDPDFRKGQGFVSVLLDKPAQRHESDGPPHREWFCRNSSLLTSEPTGDA